MKKEEIEKIKKRIDDILTQNERWINEKRKH
jgi:hypothetical protein